MTNKLVCYLDASIRRITINSYLDNTEVEPSEYLFLWIRKKIKFNDLRDTKMRHDLKIVCINGTTCKSARE